MMKSLYTKPKFEPQLDSEKHTQGNDMMACAFPEKSLAERKIH